MDSWLETQIQFLLNVETESDLFAGLSFTAKGLGFDYCAYGMRVPLPISSPKFFMQNNYSSEWKQRYRIESYLEVDPTVAHGMRSVMPLVWSDEIFVNCRSFWEEARAYGLKVGWAQSCHNAQGVGGLLTLARSHNDISLKELRDHSIKMSWLVQATHESMTRLLLPKFMPEASVELTLREIEVLRWTAEGKTSADVADIMRITERTVNFHVNNTLLKLGASNKTAATIKAAVLGML